MKITAAHRHPAIWLVASLALAVGYLAATTDAGKSQAAAEKAPEAAETSGPEAPPGMTDLWTDTAGLLGATAKTSRGLLLGKRDPAVSTCVSSDAGKGLLQNPDGGIGTGLVHFTLAESEKRSTPRQEYRWQQERLRPILTASANRNRTIYARALRLADQAAQLHRRLRAVTEWPASLKAVGLKDPGTWLGGCAYRLDRAIARRDLARAKVWAAEFASATYALADLHRWLDFLLRNHLAGLDFMARCEALYLQADEPHNKNAGWLASPRLMAFPASQLPVSALHNYTEAEHQAEWLYGPAAKVLAAAEDDLAGHDLPSVEAALWMPPHLRGAFLRLREHLSPTSRALWDEAAHTPFDRSYLANMLYRLSVADALGPLGTVLERFDRANPEPTREDLMDVIFYRGGSADGGMAWGDRFDPRLMQAAATLGGTDEQVLLGAQHFTRALLGSWSNYRQPDTLAQALDEGILDCVTATDMVGSLYRNAGRAGFYNVRWCGGTVGHTVAAAEVDRPDGPAIVIVDGLEHPQIAAEVWPGAYSGGHDWPRGFPGPRPEIFSVELFTRGLDNYVWVQGYIIRGDHAGTLARAPVPYVSTHLPTKPLRRHHASRAEVLPRFVTLPAGG